MFEAHSPTTEEDFAKHAGYKYIEKSNLQRMFNFFSYNKTFINFHHVIIFTSMS